MAKINLLGHTKHNLNYAEQLRVLDVTFPTASATGNKGHLFVSGNDLYYNNNIQPIAVIPQKPIEVSALSVSGTGMVLNRWYSLDGVVATSDEFYFKAVLQGMITGTPLTNNRSLTISTINLIIEADYTGSGTWTTVFNKAYDISFPNEVIEFELTSHAKLRIKYETTLTTLEVTPINAGVVGVGSWIAMFNVDRIPKNYWNTNIEIPAITDGGSPIEITLQPQNNAELFLAFAGYYNVNAFVEFTEVDTMSVPANVGIQQTLEIFDDGAWKKIDISPTFKSTPTAMGSRFVNTSLQGSKVINISQTGTLRKIKLRVTLPNGVTNSIVGGYVDAHYIGEYVGFGKYSQVIP